MGKEKVKGLGPPILEHLKKNPKACKPQVLLVLSRRKLGMQGPQLLKERKKTKS
jgi:hypothetical protein